MTEREAIARAKKLAKRGDKWMYIVYERGDDYNAATYSAADDYDLETFYAGLEPIMAIGPDGTIEI